MIRPLRSVLLAGLVLAALPAHARPVHALSENSAPTPASADQEAAGDAVELEARVRSLEERLASLEDRLPTPSDPETVVVASMDLPADGDASGATVSDDGDGESASSRTSFGGGVHVAAGEKVREAVAFGGTVVVDGVVEGDAVSFGGDVIVGEGAEIGGDVLSFGGEVRMSQGARIHGDRVAFSEKEAASPLSAIAQIGSDGADHVRSLVRRLVVVLCMAGAGVLVLGLFPERVRNVAHAIQHRPLRYAFAGLLLLGGFSVGALLIAITIIGLPVAGAISLLLGFALLLGFVALCQVVGDLVPLPSSWHGRLGAFLVGVLLVAIVGMVPILGKVLLALCVLPAVGAAVATRFGHGDAA